MKELGQLWLQIKLLPGDYEEALESHPALIGKKTGTKVVQRRGFPEIVLPGRHRNDFYLMLRNGEFEKSVKSNRSVQVEGRVRNDCGCNETSNCGCTFSALEIDQSQYCRMCNVLL